ncbi:MAG: tetratricopeptide repeat protein [Bacteroidetes bacterium]|nr:tetratricopeptide repeat protein [Bacteroidota bacterium]
MKTLATSLLILAALFSPVSKASAQFAFGMQYSVAAEDAYAKITLPASALVDIIKESGDVISGKDVCLGDKPQGTLTGYQADYDGDGTEEMWLLYHTGPDDAGCNVTLIITPAGGGKYQLMDLLSFPGGKALIRPIIALDGGVQMYLQNTRTMEDGNVEVKGSVLAYTQTALIILTSWTQKAGMRDDTFITEQVDAVFIDLNFDNVKELVVRYNMHETGGGAPTSKNLVDQYILTLDFLPNHLRYGVYDSVGYEKIQEAENLAKTGRGELNRDETRTEGIVKMQEALQANPFMTWARVRLGEFLLHDGKYSDAQLTLVLARSFDPEYNKTYRILGDTYLRLNDLQKALEAYERYMALGPESNYYKKKVEHNIKQITIPKNRRK